MIQDVVLNHIGSSHWWMKDMPMQDWIDLVTVQQGIVFWTIGFCAVLWLDSRGHYRQRAASLH